MDGTDLEILYHLDIDSRRPAKGIASLMGQKSEKVNYRLNNLLRGGAIRRCYAEIDPWKIGYASFKVYLQFQRVDNAKVAEMQSFLCRRCNVSWAASCVGRWDMVIDVLAKNRHDFSERYSLFHRKYCEWILRRDVGMTLETVFLNKKWLCPKKAAVKLAVMSGVPEDLVAPKDFALLGRLARDCREPLRSLSAAARMPPTTASQRIRRLVARKVIAAFRTDLDLQRFGRVLCKSFVYLSGAPEPEVRRMMDYLTRHPDVVFISRCVAPWDMEIEANVGSFSDFTRMMDGLKDRFPTVVRNYEAVAVSKETGSFSEFSFERP